MKKAKSLYLGGEIITADGLSYSSYKELGLLCCYCEEPVFPKIGYERTNHFSHFKSIDPDKLKKCQLRQENGNLSYDFNEENQAEGNNQRIEIFNRHFLEIVLGSHSELPSLSLSSSQEWKERLLFKECKVDLKDRKKSILKFYKLVPTSQSKLHRKIASEAINYLCSDSGEEVLQQLSQMAYTCLVYVETKNRLENLSESPIEADSINCKIAKIVFSTRWIKYLLHLDYLSLIDEESLEKPNNLIEALSDSAHSYIYAQCSSIFHGVFEDYQVKQEVEIANIDLKVMKHSSGIKKTPKKAIEKERWILSPNSASDPILRTEYIEIVINMLQDKWRQWISKPTEKKGSRVGSHVVKHTFKGGIVVSFNKDIKTFDEERFALLIVNGKNAARLDFNEKRVWNFSLPKCVEHTSHYCKLLDCHPDIEEAIFNLTSKYVERGTRRKL